jgi:hypothetical protein
MERPSTIFELHHRMQITGMCLSAGRRLQVNGGEKRGIRAWGEWVRVVARVVVIHCAGAERRAVEGDGWRDGRLWEWRRVGWRR